MNRTIKFSDNVCVLYGTKKNGYINEFFALNLSPKNGDWKDYAVCIYRYCVPGRIDTYCFDWEDNRRGNGYHLRYQTDFKLYGPSLYKAVQMVEKDLDMPQVVSLFSFAFSSTDTALQYGYDAAQLLKLLAPNSKSCKKVEKLMQLAREEKLQKNTLIEQEFARKRTHKTTIG